MLRWRWFSFCWLRPRQCSFDCGNGCCDPDTCDCGDCSGDTLSDLVYDYDYKPTPIFHGSGPLFLGPEIEVEVPEILTEECAAIAQSHLGKLGYLKADSSLSSKSNLTVDRNSHRGRTDAVLGPGFFVSPGGGASMQWWLREIFVPLFVFFKVKSPIGRSYV